MKTENEKLEEIFDRNMGQPLKTPDFETMWQNAKEENKKKSLLLWRMAAAVALVVTLATTALILHRWNNRQEVSMQITAWKEPTGSLARPQTDLQLAALSHWTSPTGFLVPPNPPLSK